MMRRAVWFAAGAGAGAYVVVRARRLVEAFTPDGLRDRLSGVGAAVQVFAEEVRTGMADREEQLRRDIEHRELAPGATSPPPGGLPPARPDTDTSPRPAGEPLDGHR